MSDSQPQGDLDLSDPYQVYLHTFSVACCETCQKYLELDPPFSKNITWDWYRTSANQMRQKDWYVSPVDSKGNHPLRCLCPSCKPIKNN